MVLKEKRRHTTHIKSLFDQKSIETRQQQTKSGEKCSNYRSLGKEFYREKEEAKQGNSLSNYSVSIIWDKPSWLFVIRCP